MSQSAKGPPPQEALERARRGRVASVREDALGVGYAGFARAGFSDPAFVLNWPSIAGEEVARIATPLKWQEGEDGAVLTIKCDSGSAVFLQHQTRALTERLNAYLGNRRIARIKCVPGRREPKDTPPAHAARGRPRAEPVQKPRNLPLSEALDRLLAARARMVNTGVKNTPD